MRESSVRPRAVIAFVALLMPAIAAPTPEHLHWNKPKVRSITGHRGAHSFALRIEQANFALRGRKITIRKDGMVLVDGRRTYGRDWSPSTVRSEKLNELARDV